jgi:hypothetical protein
VATGTSDVRSRAIVWVAWVTVAVSVVGWPVTSLTIFRDEPQGVLGLSWLALILGAVNTLLTAVINRDKS